MKHLLTIVMIACGVYCAAQTTASSANQQVVFVDVHVIPMDQEKVLQNQTVVTSKGKIIAVGPVATTTYNKDAFVVDGKGKFLIPGLAEMHAHVPPIDNIDPMKEVLMLFVLNGITTIRGMLGHPKHLELRESIRKGEVLGPNFYTTGPSFNGMSVTSPEAGSEMVRRQKEAGYDYLKLHPGLTRQEFDAIASTAKKSGIPFAGHVSFGVGVWRAIEAGYSSIDHLDGFVEGLVPGIEKLAEQQAGSFGMLVADQADRKQIPRLMKALRAGNIWVVPTQSLAERWFNPDFSVEDFQNDPDHVYMNPTVVQQWINSKNDLVNDPDLQNENIGEFIQLRRDLILACQKNGVGLLLGCDAPQVFNVPGFSTHNELEYLVKAGLTPYQALQTGTTNVAEYLKQQNSGVVRQGAVSDLILLDGNPLTDIAQTRRISGVMLGDRWMARDFIDGELQKLKKKQD